jgi:thioredoxin-related protein
MNSRRMISIAATSTLVCSLLAADDSRPSATDIMDQAKAQVANGHRAIFAIFHASWCGWCKHLDRYIESPENKPIFDKYFVTAHITVQEQGEKEQGEKTSLNTPGGDELFNRLGGGPAGLPFFAFLDAGGALIVNTIRPGENGKQGENIGYPVQPSEIEWFMTMLSKAAPRMTPEEAATLEKWLRKPKN